ncbi:hypothetical protein FSP39_019877 [Pinctada imbricata]|uniref:Fatty acid hydroxylase domain-containing protein n=1 Tax=Pinctada imbricata TaxID=66713 RepID=A0AA88XTG5_PINIB|nr:hypothetical protein FSP39_019877 [Pinctada imbricata]
MGNRCRLRTAICHGNSRRCGYPGLRAHNPPTFPITQRSRRTYSCSMAERIRKEDEEMDRASAKTAFPMGASAGRSSQLVLLWIIRTLVILIIAICKYYETDAQKVIDEFWSMLKSSWIFNSVYFETWWATLCYAWMIPVYPFALHFMTFLDKFKVHPSVTYIHQSIIGMLKEAVYYMTPLMLLDTFIVKKYSGVDPSIWNEKRQSWLQTTRALPEESPLLNQIVFQLTASILMYDALFFAIHFVLHKNLWLYKNIHALHHRHDVMHAHVTNQLTVVERITLILSANFALKVFNSHPLTRFLFVPVFIFLLVDNHTGYDLPFGLHHVIPFGIMGGPAKHYQHHLHGARNYQPFLTYLDYIVEKTKGI